MKKSTAILIGVGVTVAAAAIVAGVVYELKTIKRLTTDVDDLPDELPLPAEELDAIAE